MVDCRIQTYTGKRFDVHETTPEMIDIEDIATALSRMPRFCGHSIYFLSVAEHCVNVCQHGLGREQADGADARRQ